MGDQRSHIFLKGDILKFEHSFEGMKAKWLESRKREQ